MTIFWVALKKVVPGLALVAVVGVLLFAMYLATVGWRSAGDLAEETQQQLDASASEVSRLVQEQTAFTQRVEQARQSVNALDAQLNQLSETVQLQRVSADALSGARTGLMDAVSREVGNLTSKLPLPDTGDVVLGDLPSALQANAFDTALFDEWLDDQIQSLRAQCEGYRPGHVVRYVLFPRYCGRVDDAVRTLEAWRTQVQQTAAAVVQARQAVTKGEASWQAVAARLRELETQRDGVMRQRLTQGEALSGLTSQAEALQANLVRAQQERARLLQAAQPEGWGAWLYAEWLKSWRWIVWTSVVAVLAGFLYRTLSVNVWPSRELLTRQLLDDGLPGTATFEAPQATAEVVVQPGETVLIRNRNYVRKRDFGAATTRWIYDRNAWNSSVGAGLYFMTKIQPAADSIEPVSMTLAGKEVQQGTSQIVRVDLADHPGLVVRPDSLVALTEGMGVQVKSYWRQWPVTGQLRHVLLSGTGTIWLEGVGGIVGETYNNSQAVQDMGPYLAYDGRLLAGFRRTDTKLPYMLGKTNLIETTLTGSGVFLWQRGEASAFANPVSKSLEFGIAVISKAFGS